jgi:hypothetical protein
MAVSSATNEQNLHYCISALQIKKFCTKIITFNIQLFFLVDNSKAETVSQILWPGLEDL